MSPTIEDLSPFFDDPCWMCVLLARQANIGVILRRGPTQWWRVTLWNTKNDTFEGGQWFRGRIYPEKCDVSPNGKLFIYFAGQWRPRNVAKGYDRTWTAVSRPPYLTALTLWPEGSTWHGGGFFVDDTTLRINSMQDPTPTHPDHPLGPLKQLDGKAYAILTTSSEDREWPRANPANIRLSCSVQSRHDPSRGPYFYDFSRAASRNTYTIFPASGPQDPIASFDAYWADLDQSGRLVATAGGRVLAGTITDRNQLLWSELANLSDEKPITMEAPDWAKHW